MNKKLRFQKAGLFVVLVIVTLASNVLLISCKNDDPTPASSISEVVPNKTLTGTTVVIKGKDLPKVTSNIKVLFGNVEAKVVVHLPQNFCASTGKINRRCYC